MNYGSKSNYAPSELSEVRNKLALLKMKKQVPNDYVPPFGHAQPYYTDYQQSIGKKETANKSSQHYREKFYPEPVKKDSEYGKMSKLATIAQNNIINSKPPLIKPQSKQIKKQTHEDFKNPIEFSSDTKKFDNMEVPISKLKSKDPMEMEDESANIKRYPCQHCGRKFAEEALAKHESNCQKVFLNKRKVFNAASKRLVSKEQAKLITEHKSEQTTKSSIAPKAKKLPKWKMQSEQFRKAVGKPGKDGEDSKQGNDEQDLDSRVPCPYCGRSFKEETANRHIPFCKNKSEMDKIKSTSKRKIAPKKR